MPAPIAQPCMHPAAASRRKSGRRSRHRTKNYSATALPLSRAARAVRPNERAPLRGWAAQPTRGGGGRTEEHRRRRADERARRKRAKRGARDNHVQAPDRKERTPKGCARDGRFRQAGPQFAQANGVIKIRGQAHANV